MGRKRTELAEILAQLPAARARDARGRNRGRFAASARYDRKSGRIVLELTNGDLFAFSAAAIPNLAHATPEQLERVQTSPGGYGIEWEELDVELSVPGLLMARIGKRERLRELARLAGQSRSPAKAAAARRNGRKGGRPRKGPTPRRSGS